MSVDVFFFYSGPVGPAGTKTGTGLAGGGWDQWDPPLKGGPTFWSRLLVDRSRGWDQ